MKKKNKIALYTCIINPTATGIHENYDSLKDPAVIEDGIDYVCFTNNRKLKSEIYEMRYLSLIHI